MTTDTTSIKPLCLWTKMTEVIEELSQAYEMSAGSISVFTLPVLLACVANESRDAEYYHHVVRQLVDGVAEEFTEVFARSAAALPKEHGETS